LGNPTTSVQEIEVERGAAKPEVLAASLGLWDKTSLGL
jgi:hypothetical protein